MTEFQSSRACNSAIYATDVVWSRARAVGCYSLKSGLRSLPRRASAAFKSAVVSTPLNGVIAAAHLLPAGSVLARGLKRIFSLSRLASGLFLQEDAGTGVLGFRDFCRAFEAAGKPTFLCSCVQACKQARGSIFHRFQVPPVWLPSCAAHVEQHATKEIPNVGKAVGEFGNV